MLESFYQYSYIFSFDNVLPALASLSVVLLLLQKCILKVRTKFPITVNCWFCNSDTRVPYNSSNSWYCPQCDQYNGFTADGSYNRVIVEQFNGKLNCDSWSTRTKQKQAATNGLCRFCNINLELKVQQLAQFVPLNKKNYDEEVQQYSNQLERVYRLCTKCQNVLEKTLHEKQETYVLKQPKQFIGTSAQVARKPSVVHKLCLCVTSLCSVGLLLSAVPPGWVGHVVEITSLPDYINNLLLVALSYVPQPAQSLVLLSSVGAIVQLCDWMVMKSTSSCAKLLLWLILPTLNHVPAKFPELVSFVKVLASVVLFVTSVTEKRIENCQTHPVVNPQQFQKLDKNPEIIPPRKRETAADVRPYTTTLSSKSTVSDVSPTCPTPIAHEPTPEDLGFGKLNVSSRRVTRSQMKPFQAKHYGSQVQNSLFKQKPVNLSPPKLHFDNVDYQVPLTRSSSQSSGFVSLSNQKDYDEYRSPSMIADDNIDSVSQCAGGVMSRYQSNTISPMSLSNPYGMPFSPYQPYAIVHYSHSHFNKLFPYHNLPSIEGPLNVSVPTLTTDGGWWLKLKNGLYSICIFILILTNLAILWKEFGREYFILSN